jgi:3-oxoacyl-[acyl-carrier protein] reductase
VRVNAIGPGFIETPLNEKMRASNPALVQVFMDHTPLGRPGKPEDIVVKNLLTDSAHGRACLG